jgi:hypothetical protein
MENDFRAILAGSTTLTALVSTRIYPSTYVQNSGNPAIRYAKITGADALHMQGTDGLDVSTMQIDIRAKTAAEVLSIRDALRTLLNPYSGTQGSTQFSLISLRDDRGVKFETTGAESFYTASLDFDVTSRASA